MFIAVSDLSWQFCCAPRSHTMIKFLTHEALAQKWFNRNEVLAAQAHTAWTEVLVNTPESLQLLCARLCSDWLAVNPKLRKPWSGSQVEAWPQLALFLTSPTACRHVFSFGRKFRHGFNRMTFRSHWPGFAPPLWHVGESLWRSSQLHSQQKNCRR